MRSKEVLLIAVHPALSTASRCPPLDDGLLREPGGDADDGGAEEERGGEIEGVVLVTRLVHQPARDRGTCAHGSVCLIFDKLSMINDIYVELDKYTLVIHLLRLRFGFGG